MILQQLVKDAERIVKKMPPTMYGPTPIKWIISLDAHGAFLECIPTVENEHTKKDKGQIKQAPILSRKRTSGITPQLLVDKPSYVFGIPADDKRAPKEAASFRALVNECYQATGEATVQAVAAFLTWWDAGEPSLSRLGLSEIGDNDLITFRIGGILPIDVPGVQQFWAAKSSASEGDSLGGALSQCLVCGRQTVIPKCLPVPIKGLHGGQASGIPLVSINAEAFESFNLHDGTTSRVCGDCGERFGKALNHLLAAEDGHLAVGPLVYVFWTRQGGGFAWATLLQQPQAGAVRELLASYRTGKPFTVADAEAFYATALSASGGRAVVRDWLQTTVGDAAAHLAQWFARLKQVDSFGQPGEPLGVYKLAASLYRDANKEMVAQVPRVLVRTALHGGPLPQWLLTQAVNRCRAEQRVTYPRAALMKAVLQSLTGMKEDSMAQLEPTEQRPAYLCGRLLAVLEAVQYAAQGKINTTLVDRFYGAASTAPASVFGNLLGDVQAHLAKLRKTRPAACTALQQRLETVMRGLPSFPRTLSLQDQALFGLGYYHQRAQDRADAQARKAAGDAAQTDTIETEEETP